MDTGRKSEILQNQPIEGIEINDILKAKTGVAKATIKENILDTFTKAYLEHSQEELKKSQEFDDLIGFPSDDETSKKVKNEVIDDINLNITTSENNENDGKTDKNNNHLIRPEIELSKINNKSTDEGKTKGENSKYEEEQVYSAFPSINDNKSINHNDHSNYFKEYGSHNHSNNAS